MQKNRAKQVKSREISRKTLVTLHKSGKHWGSTVMTNLGLVKWSSQPDFLTQGENFDGLRPANARLVKGALSLGMLVAGASMNQLVMADEVTTATVSTTTETLVGQDYVTVDTNWQKAPSTQNQASSSNQVSYQLDATSILPQDSQASQSAPTSEIASSSETDNDQASVNWQESPTASQVARQPNAISFVQLNQDQQVEPSSQTAVLEETELGSSGHQNLPLEKRWSTDATALPYIDQLFGTNWDDPWVNASEPITDFEGSDTSSFLINNLTYDLVLNKDGSYTVTYQVFWNQEIDDTVAIFLGTGKDAFFAGNRSSDNLPDDAVLRFDWESDDQSWYSAPQPSPLLGNTYLVAAVDKWIWLKSSQPTTGQASATIRLSSFNPERIRLTLGVGSGNLLSDTGQVVLDHDSLKLETLILDIQTIWTSQQKGGHAETNPPGSWTSEGAQTSYQTSQTLSQEGSQAASQGNSQSNAQSSSQQNSQGSSQSHLSSSSNQGSQTESESQAIPTSEGASLSGETSTSETTAPASQSASASSSESVIDQTSSSQSQLNSKNSQSASSQSDSVSISQPPASSQASSELASSTEQTSEGAASQNNPVGEVTVAESASQRVARTARNLDQLVDGFQEDSNAALSDSDDQQTAPKSLSLVFPNDDTSQDRIDTDKDSNTSSASTQSDSSTGSSAKSSGAEQPANKGQNSEASAPVKADDQMERDGIRLLAGLIIVKILSLFIPKIKEIVKRF